MTSYDLFLNRFNRNEGYCRFGNQGCKVWSRPILLMESRNSLKKRTEMITHQPQQTCCVWATGKPLIEVEYAPARSDPDKASVQKIRCFLGCQPQRNTAPTNLCDTMQALTPQPQPQQQQQEEEEEAQAQGKKTAATQLQPQPKSQPLKSHFQSMSEHLETPNYPFTAVHTIVQSNQAIHRWASVWLVKVTFCRSSKMPSWTAFCRTPSAKLIFLLPASTKDINLCGIESTLSMRLEAKSKNSNTSPKPVQSKITPRSVFGTFPVRPQPAAPMLLKWRQSSNGAKNSDTEASMANPLTSKVVILGKGQSLRPPVKSILVLVPVNFKIWRYLNSEFTCKVPVTSVSLRSTSLIRGQLPRTSTSPAILVLKRRQKPSWARFNAPRFPVTLLFDRSRNEILASAKAAKFPLTKVFWRTR